MPHVMEVAKSGRSVCRSCRENIEKGALRFGEEVPNAFDPDGGTTHQWHHVMCAAQKKPHQLKDALAIHEGALENRAELEKTVEEALLTARPPFPYVEHASSGRSRCQVCRQAVEKGDLRLAVARPAGSMPQESAAYLHPKCAQQHVKDAGLFLSVRKNSRGLTDEEWIALEAALQLPPDATTA